MGGEAFILSLPRDQEFTTPGGEKVLYVSVNRKLKQHIMMATVTKTSLKK